VNWACRLSIPQALRHEFGMKQVVPSTTLHEYHSSAKTMILPALECRCTVELRTVNAGGVVANEAGLAGVLDSPPAVIFGAANPNSVAAAAAFLGGFGAVGFAS